MGLYDVTSGAGRSVLTEGPVGLASDVINGVKDFLANPFSKKVPDLFPKPDFPEGFTITEFVNGKPVSKWDRIALVGSWLPMQPFSFGGKQRIVKDHYPGTSEPVVHVLGPEETDLTINGKLDAKKMQPLPGPDAVPLETLRQIATELQQQLDAIRLRGNLLKLTLGEWKRYGFLEETKFDMKTLSKVKYQLQFSIVGFNKPRNMRIIDKEKSIPFDINKDLIKAMEEWQKKYSSIPKKIPRSIADLMNEIISDVAEVVGTVTGFVDSTLGAVEDVNKAINRALGVVDYAISSIYRARQRFSRLGINHTIPGSLWGDLGTSERYIGAAFIVNASSSTFDLSALLAQLRDRFAQLRLTIPQARHKVNSTDTLHSIAIQYYNEVSLWEKIYEHNKLTSTLLEVGTVLEIPRN